jgi:hypothetical protein
MFLLMILPLLLLAELQPIYQGDVFKTHEDCSVSADRGNKTDPRVEGDAWKAVGARYVCLQILAPL